MVGMREGKKINRQVPLRKGAHLKQYGRIQSPQPINNGVLSLDIFEVAPF